MSDDVSGLLLYSLITADPTFRTLTGAVVGVDSRMYPYYNADAVISATKPAYVTYMEMADPPQQGAISAPVWSVAIWALTEARVRAIRNRLVALLSRKTFVDATGDEVFIEKVHGNDSYQQDSKFYGKTLHFKLSKLVISEVA